jgi:ketopantoate reductase
LEVSLNIIGSGRVGSFFSSLLECKVYTRHDVLEGFVDGPILIATRNDDLDKILATIPEMRKDDLVFIQNGMYLPLVKKHLSTEPTLLLIYFAIQAKGDLPVDGGGSLVTGKHSDLFRRLFTKNNIELEKVERDSFLKAMYEKLLWNCVFGLLCRIYDKPVGEIVEVHSDVISKLTSELVEVIEGTQNIKLGPFVDKNLCNYSMSIKEYKGDVKEFPWRNGWFVDQRRSDYHVTLLKRADLGFKF